MATRTPLPTMRLSSAEKPGLPSIGSLPLTASSRKASRCSALSLVGVSRGAVLRLRVHRSRGGFPSFSRKRGRFDLVGLERDRSRRWYAPPGARWDGWRQLRDRCEPSPIQTLFASVDIYKLIYSVKEPPRFCTKILAFLQDEHEQLARPDERRSGPRQTNPTPVRSQETEKPKLTRACQLGC
jgi:hypothetical protein